MLTGFSYYAKSRGFAGVSASILLILVMSFWWSNSDVALVGSSTGGTIRLQIFISLVVGLILSASHLVSLGQVERIGTRTIFKYKLGHVVWSLVWMVVSGLFVANFVDSYHAQVFVLNTLAVTGLTLAVAQLERVEWKWLPALVLVLVMWMFGTEEPVNTPREWAWLLPRPNQELIVWPSLVLALIGFTAWIRGQWKFDA